MREIHKVPMEDTPFEEAFDEFCQGFSIYGPYWDHILGYSKASLERPETTLFLKYEDMQNDPTSNVKRLAEFIGYPFTAQEVKEGVIESIIKMCSFENLSNLEINKTGLQKGERFLVPECNIRPLSSPILSALPPMGCPSRNSRIFFWLLLWRLPRRSPILVLLPPEHA
ncbi:putative quercetin-3-sulfate 4'-sulfotransferase [Helianthus debilis subsp. tardiflorus]